MAMEIRKNASLKTVAKHAIHQAVRNRMVLSERCRKERWAGEHDRGDLRHYQEATKHASDLYFEVKDIAVHLARLANVELPEALD